MIYIAIAVAVVIGLLGAQNWYLNKRVDGLKVDVAAEQARVQRFVAAEAVLQAKVAEQDKAVAEFVAQSEAAIQASAAAVEAARKSAEAATVRERELRERVRTGDVCKDISGLLSSPPR